MKRIILFLILILALWGAAALTVRPALRAFAQRSVASVVPGAAVSIEDCRLDLFRRLTFLNVRFKRDKVYDVRLGEVSLHYSLSSLLKKRLNRTEIKGADIRIDLSDKSILTYGQYLGLGRGGSFSLERVSLSDVHFDISSSELQWQGMAAVDLDVQNGILKTILLEVDSFKSGKFLLKGGRLKVGESPRVGEFYVKTARYDKAGIKDLNGRPRIDGYDLIIDPFSGQAYGGEVTGTVFMKIGQGLAYTAEVTFKSIGLEGLLKDLELTEKFQMTGAVNGALAVSGRGADLNILNGGFMMDALGGVLTIKDTRFLEHMAKSTDQPLDILVESFKQYHYNSGNVALSLEEEDIVLDMALEGETGKRNLNITLHDVMQERSAR